MADLCPICNKDITLEKSVLTTKKGIENILKFSVQRNDGLREKLKGVSSIRVHESCRKNYTRRIAAQENAFVFNTPPPRPLLRSTCGENFNFERCCVLCGREVPLTSAGGVPRADRGVSVITTDDMKSTLLEACKGQSEEWVRKAAIRIAGVASLTAAGACYHRACLAAILKHYSPKSTLSSPGSSPVLASPSPSTPSPLFPAKTPKRPATSPAEGSASRIPVPRIGRGRGRGHVGRLQDAAKMEAFNELCSQLENSDECQFSFADLIAMMPTSSSSSSYSEKHLSRLLQAKYGDSLIVIERPGKSSIFCFLGQRFDKLGEDLFKLKGLREGEQRKWIVRKAGEIIRSDIASMAYEKDFFPTAPEVKVGGTSLVPESLTELLHTICMKRKRGKGIENTILKCQVIAHSVISAARPKSFVSPIHLGLALWVHRKLGSKTLCNILFKMGSSCSYSTVQDFERAVTISANYDVDPSAYIQCAFDNFDFNIATLTGHGTFHSMGGMLYVTPRTAVPPQGPIPRLSSEQKKLSLAQYGVIPLQVYSRPAQPGFNRVAVMDLRPALHPTQQRALHAETCAMKARQLDLLWVVGFTGLPQVMPAWNGFMSTVMKGTASYSLSATIPLPFVNLNPSDPSTIYSCLIFAAEQARKQGQKRCAVTFDQPLFWKATEMVLASPEDSDLRSILVRLGGFHLLMSFMGAVGNLMSGSGLEELWTTVYAANSVPQMLSGKSYSRAVRAHFLTQTVLLDALFQRVFLTVEDTAIRREVLQLCSRVFHGEDSLTSVEGSDTLLIVMERLQNVMSALETQSRTSKLWIEYIRQVEIMRMLIRAERLGEWTLHLHAVRHALPYFHAAGHLNYAKTAHLYTQLMFSLEDSMSNSEFVAFCDRGFFTIRQQDKYWGGNFSDQTIEMGLMRPMKSIGGITMHGRGITESTLAVWVRTMPHCTEVIDGFETFCGLTTGISEQHIELRDSRITRDARDLNTLRRWMEQHDPFGPREQLVSLSSGMVAGNNINCDQAFEIGCRAMEKMAGKLYSELTLHRKDKAVPLSAMTRSVTVRGNVVQVNPTQLFHRIILVTKNPSDLEKYFEYELAPYPTTLFDEKGMRKTDKSKMVAALEGLFVHSDDRVPEGAHFVVDGGFLLRKVVWPRPASYADVLNIYVKYVLSHYGLESIVVFDGYPEGPTTKDPEHNLRAAAGTSPDLEFEADMTIPTTQTKFLSNGRNKDRLIQLLSSSLQKAGVAVEKARADADRQIVVRAIEVAESSGNPCVVVGTDTDLLVLLVGLTPPGLSLHFMIPASGRTSQKVHHIESIQTSMGTTAPNILVAHPFSGTDTVSAIFRMPKKKALQKLCEPGLKKEAEIFRSPGQTHKIVAAAGEKIFLALYGCAKLSSLREARCHIYKRTVARQSVHANFELPSLPPTSKAARQHSFRAYLQIQEWLGNDLPPTEWGWRLLGNQFQPVTTTDPPAPEHLLDLISCNCRDQCEGGCPCALAGIKCGAICGQCTGTGCSNAEAALDTDSEDDGADCGTQETLFEDPDEDPDDPTE